MSNYHYKSIDEYILNKLIDNNMAKIIKLILTDDLRGRLIAEAEAEEDDEDKPERTFFYSNKLDY